MKILIFGADGFVGREIHKVLARDHQVYCATRRHQKLQSNEVNVDLLNKSKILAALIKIKPEVIINCAGVIDATQEVSNNLMFTSNILTELVESKLAVKRVVIMGSAAEYGVVKNEDAPVSEDTLLDANSAYGISKVDETSLALKFRETYKLPVIIARVFNPIGKDMHSKFLISRIINQLADFKAGKLKSIEVSRLDSLRDYVSIEDVAEAVRALVEGPAPVYGVYNIGSGSSTSNLELLDLVIKYSGLYARPEIIETSPTKEPSVASRADISRIHTEFAWFPKHSLEDSIKDILNATNNQ